VSIGADPRNARMTETPGLPRIVLASDHALLVSFGEEISPENSRRVLRLLTALRSRAVPGILNLHPAYASLLIRFDPLGARVEALREIVEEAVAGLGRVPLPESRLVEIPVRYGGEHGPDLTDVARHCGVAENEVVRRHPAGDYEVAFLGFTPGFPYLAGLDPALAVPRLATPRKRVPAGSVAIGGSQTGIYPLPSPGGWRVIGWTPLSLFDPAREPVSLVRMGDRVVFVQEPA
jgi:KipI family sensor histidine kinase inhibitor